LKGVPVGHFLQWLNDSGFSTGLRESEIAFPLTECCHLVGLAVSVGVIIWLDLRLLGLAMRSDRVSEVVSRLEPIAKAGFLLMFLSGIMLFMGNPMNYYETIPFRIKMCLLPLTGLNVLFFHKKVYPTIDKWDSDPVPPWQGRMVGMISLVLWLAIIVLGRWTAYSASAVLLGEK
jgi:hypothetical protein